MEINICLAIFNPSDNFKRLYSLRNAQCFEVGERLIILRGLRCTALWLLTNWAYSMDNTWKRVLVWLSTAMSSFIINDRVRGINSLALLSASFFVLVGGIS